MLEQQARLEKFLAVIKKDEKNKRLQIERETAEECKRQLDEFTQIVRKNAKEQRERETVKLKARHNRAVSEAAAESRKRVAKKRSELTEDVFKAARERLKTFTASNGYEGFLVKSAEELSLAFTGDDTVILVRACDMKFEAAIKAAFGKGCELKADEGIEIGGLRAYSAKLSLRADDTLETRLLLQRDSFLLWCGKKAEAFQGENK